MKLYNTIKYTYFCLYINTYTSTHLYIFHEKSLKFLKLNCIYIYKVFDKNYKLDIFVSLIVVKDK